MGYLLLLFFTFVEMMILPSFGVVFVNSRIPIPGLTLLFLDLAGWMREYWPVVAIGLLVLGAALFQIRRLGRWRKLVEVPLVLAGAFLCAGTMAAAVLPMIGLLEGTWHR
jgi:type II secretory pathway component PulF